MKIQTLVAVKQDGAWYFTAFSCRHFKMYSSAEVKQDGAWYFTAFHNTRVRPIAQSLRNVIAWQLADMIWKLIASKGSP